MPYHRGIPRAWHRQRAYSFAKRPKPVFIIVLPYPRPNGEPPRGASLPGTAAWAGGSEPFAPMVMSRMHISLTPTPYKHSTMYACCRANAPSAAWKHCRLGRKRTIPCTQQLSPAQPCLSPPPGASALLPCEKGTKQAAELPQQCDRGSEFPPIPFPSSITRQTASW